MKSKLYYHKKLLYLYLIILITNLIFISSHEDNLTCQNLSTVFHKNSSEIISLISKNFNSLKVHSHLCIDALVKFCKIPVLDYYLDQLRKNSILYKDNLDVSLDTIFTKINEVYNKRRFIESDYQDVIPSSRWAQSLDEIFIEIKFAHKYDSPGCLEIKNLKVEVKEKSVSLLGYCVLGDIPLKMNYYIETFDKINPKESRHFASAIGKYQFNLKKQMNNTYWKQLLDDKMKPPNNMKMWFEMKEKYRAQLSKYEEDYNDNGFIKYLTSLGEDEDKEKDNDNDDNIDKDIKEKKKKKKKKKKKNKKNTDL